MANTRLRLFVSSVQKELENERLTILSLVTTDSFLFNNYEAILYEYAPASPKKSIRECLEILDSCDICLTIVGKEYGATARGLSVTHQEYKRAKKQNKPILVFVKGDSQFKRDEQTNRWFQEIKKDGIKYKRFGNIFELQKEARCSLVEFLKQRFNIIPSPADDKIAEQTIEAASSFEIQAIKRLKWSDLNHALAKKLTIQSGQRSEKAVSDKEIVDNMTVRGLVWVDAEIGEYYATAAGIVFLGNDPSAVFPQCRILIDAYNTTVPDGAPIDQEDIRGPAPLIIERALAFIDRNTRHPMRIVGLNRMRLDEYPSEALREALVNAVAHRNYEDAGRKITVEVFSDHVVISSPGLPPKPLTIQKLRSGKYKPCSRNPILAQSLSYFHRIEERGSGFRRMYDKMIDHGLTSPILSEDTGYFQVIFKGPGKNIDRLRISAKTEKQIIPPSIVGQLNDRQKKMLKILLKSEVLTSSFCEKRFGITRTTSASDFALLVKLGLVVKQGKGRATHYVLAPRNNR